MRVMRRIKGDMPVDTGRARAAWGIYTPTLLQAADSASTPGDAIWEVSDREIVQGAALDYLEILNSGSSRQAPAGFIDKRAIEGEAELEQVLGALADIGERGLRGTMERIIGTGPDA